MDKGNFFAFEAYPVTLRSFLDVVCTLFTHLIRSCNRSGWSPAGKCCESYRKCLISYLCSKRMPNNTNHQADKICKCLLIQLFFTCKKLYWKKTVWKNHSDGKLKIAWKYVRKQGPPFLKWEWVKNTISTSQVVLPFKNCISWEKVWH